MLVLQTAFDQEFAAVMAAGSPVMDARDPTITIASRACLVVMTGIGPQAARKQFVAMLNKLNQPPELVLSIGLAGGLQSELKFGQACLIGSVLSLEPASQAVSVAIPASLERLSSNLRERLAVSNLVTLTAPALTAQSKRQLAQQTSAALCDMETYAIAAECQQRRLPWIGARVVSDTARDSIPGWILTLPRLIEQKRWRQLLGRVATHPQHLPSLIRLALRMQRLKPILTELTIDLVTHVLPA